MMARAAEALVPSRHLPPPIERLQHPLAVDGALLEVLA